MAIYDRLSKMHTTSSSPTTAAVSNAVGGDVLVPKKVVVSQEASDAIVERMMAAVGHRKDEISMLTAQREEMFRRDETFSPTLPKKTLVLANKLSMKARAEAIVAARMQQHPSPDSFALRRVGSDASAASPNASSRNPGSPRFSQLYPGVPEKQDNIPARAPSSDASEKNPMYISGKLGAGPNTGSPVAHSPASPVISIAAAATSTAAASAAAADVTPEGAARSSGAVQKAAAEWSPRAASGSPAAANVTAAYKAVPAASAAYEPPTPVEVSPTQFDASVKAPAVSLSALSSMFPPNGHGAEQGQTAVDDLPVAPERRTSQKAMAMAALSQKGVPMSPATITTASTQGVDAWDRPAGAATAPSLSSPKVPPPRQVSSPQNSQKDDSAKVIAMVPNAPNSASLTPTYHI